MDCFVGIPLKNMVNITTILDSKYFFRSSKICIIEKINSEVGMNRLRIGMYVRVPMDKEHPDDARQFVLGQITDMDSFANQATVRIYDFDGIKESYGVTEKVNISLERIFHCRIIRHTKCLFDRSIEGQIVCFAKEDESGFYHYYIEVKENGDQTTLVLSEKELRVSFTRGDVNPLEQMLQYELQNPKWYLHRRIVEESLHSLRNATYGFETLVGSRVFLLPHQVDTIVRAIADSPCRFMLADEVGLGKTIQACVIIKGLHQRWGKLSTLILVPESLVYQWQNELSLKFWKDIPVWEPGSEVGDEVIFPLEQVATREGRKVLGRKWDLCVVDETHRLLSSHEEYPILLDLCKRVKHVLLLTATPVQSRRTEYLQLLRLLQPKKYELMGESEFSTLLEKQELLRSRVHSMVRDLEYYLEDELAESFVADLQDIAQDLQDDVFNGLVKDIDILVEDQGLSQVRLALAYLAEHYQLERRILRHRRMELRDKMPTRVLERITYNMAGSAEGFYEADTYEGILEYLQSFLNSGVQKDLKADFAQVVLSAFFSSPWALLTVLRHRLDFIAGEKAIIERGKPNVSVLSACPGYLGEREELVEVIQLAENWERASRYEMEHVDDLYNDPDLICGRLMKVVDYLLSAGSSEKIVVFSDWTETILALQQALEQTLGVDAVRSFHRGKSKEDLQMAVDDFQGQLNCRFMLCDDLGGEGRNFQMADKLVLIDLPWSPATLEQRIGRLDRIGRDKPVLSVICTTEQTIEEDLFRLWDEGLNIFRESLSGLEIALGDIQDEVQKALMTDLRFGLGEVFTSIQSGLSAMRSLVDEERYYDMARQLDPAVEEQLRKLIDKFDAEEGQSLTTTMMSWAHMTGLNASSSEKGHVIRFPIKLASINSMKNTFFVPPDMSEARKRAKHRQEIRGTFKRSFAVQREDLIFYAPGDPFFDAIVRNADETPRGTCCAFIRRSEVDWKGFVLTWSVSLDPVYLLDLGESLEHMVLAQGYIPLEPIVTINGYSASDREKDLADIRGRLFGSLDEKIIHLGRRGGSNLPGISAVSNYSWFKQQTAGSWQERVQRAYKDSISEVRNLLTYQIDSKRAENDFQRRLNGLRASNLYYGKTSNIERNEEEKMARIYDALLKGLIEPRIELESMAFVWLATRQ